MVIDIFGNFLDKNNPYLHIIRALENDDRVQINLMGPVHRSLLDIQRRKYQKGSVALSFGTARDAQGMHMGSYDAKLGYISWETTKVPYGSFYGFEKSLQDLDLLIVPDSWQAKLFSSANKHIAIVPMAATLSSDQRLNSDEQLNRTEFTFLCAGKLTHKTNVGYIISAVMALSQKYPNIKLILKTEGGTLGHLQFPEKNIEIIDGELTEEEHIKLYQRADCFVYPTSADGLPIEYFNAIAMGLQVIAPTHSSFDIANDLRKHTEIPAQRYSKKLGDVGNYWSIDYDELLDCMENAINRKNPFYGSTVDYHTAEGFVHDIIKLTKELL